MKLWPLVNASLNALAGVCLLMGWRAIKKGCRLSHQRWMMTAMGCSSLFLCSYLIYHALQGSTPYQGQGFLRTLYFSILLTHTPLAVLIVPFSLWALWYALQGKFAQHVRITRRLFPVWIYVSITGVLIYLMLYVF